MSESYQSIQYCRVSLDQQEDLEGQVISETPVSLTVNGLLWLTLMCTPTDLEAMAVGFLYNENIIKKKEEIASVRVCLSGDNVDVWLHHHADKPKEWRRTSGCTGGVTGVQSRAGAQGMAALKTNGDCLSAEQVYDLVGGLFEAQTLYRKTGGVHTSALSDSQSIRLVAEDIGRHNTLDKIAGRCVLEGIWPERRVLITTGRISSEMLQKSMRIGASIVISRTSPSSMSIALAQEWGITLIGYAHRNRFNIYAHPQRILVRLPSHPGACSEA